jgi:DNA-binding beta-propeller fold protein YncE
MKTITTALTIAGLMALLLLGGCGHQAGIIFPYQSDAPLWPTPPEQARIRYVGQLTGSTDLKPAVSGVQQLGATLFGSGATYTFVNPTAICTDGANRVFITDSGDHVIHVMDLASRQYARWTPTGRNLNSPVGIAYDSGGRRLLVADSVEKAIFVFDNQGKFIGELAPGQLKHPCGLAVDRTNGEIFVADVGAHQIIVLSPTGHIIQRLGARGDAPGQFNYPTYVAMDAKGRLYVSDSLNFRVQQFTPHLDPLRQFGKQGDMPGYFAQPKGLALDAENHLYVVDSQFEAVQIFDDSGQLLLNFGEQGKDRGEFWLPTSIFIDHNNRIWVTDSYNHRVQVFDYLPEAKS